MDGCPIAGRMLVLYTLGSAGIVVKRAGHHCGGRLGLRWQYAFSVDASDAETTFRISSERLSSFTARAITRAPTIVANVAIALLRFAAAALPL